MINTTWCLLTPVFLLTTQSNPQRCLLATSSQLGCQLNWVSRPQGLRSYIIGRVSKVVEHVGVWWLTLHRWCLTGANGMLGTRIGWRPLHAAGIWKRDLPVSFCSHELTSISGSKKRPFLERKRRFFGKYKGFPDMIIEKVWRKIPLHPLWLRMLSWSTYRPPSSPSCKSPFLDTAKKIITASEITL